MIEEWKISPLNEVCSEIIDCINKTAPTVDNETPFKMIRTTNVKNGKIDVTSVKYVTKEVFEQWTRRTKPRRNDIILTREAPLGEVGLLRSDDNIFLGQRLIQYRANEKEMDQLYLYYAFQEGFMQGQIRSYGSGATVEHLRIKDCETINVKYPPLPIQRKIASILSSYDDLIENNTQRIKLLEEMAEEIYKEWFVRMRFPGYQDTKFVNQEGKEVSHGAVGALPEGWEYVKASNVFDINIGKTPPRIEPQWFSENINDIKWASIKDINDSNVYILDTSEKITKEGVLKYNMRIAPQDTVLLSFKLTVGKVAITSENMLTNEAIAHFNINSNNLNTTFTYWYLRLFQYSKLGNTSSIGDAINSKIVKAMPVLLPSETIVRRFGTIVNPMMEKIKVLVNKNKVLQETRDLLLPRLISGKLSVEELELNKDVIHA